MTADLLAAIAGSVLSLLFAYVPKLNGWYAKQTKQGKAGVMAVALLVVSVGVFAFSCAGLAVQLGLDVFCTKADALKLAQVLFTALITNQGTFTLFVRPFQAK